jgi:hypothetical protein
MKIMARVGASRLFQVAMHVLLPASLVLVALATTRLLLAIEITQQVTFTTSNQSLFGPGQGSTCCNPQEISFFSWGATPNNNSFVKLPLGPLSLGIDPVDFPGGSASFGASGSSEGEIKLVNTLTLDSGSIHATLPYDVTIQLPTYSEFTQDGFTVVVQEVKYKNNGAMSSTSPLMQFESKLQFNGKAQVAGNASASFLGNEWQGDFSAKFPTNQEQFQFDLDLVSFNKTENGKPNGQVRILNFLKLSDLVKKILDPKRASAKLVEDPEKLKDPETGKAATTPPPPPKEEARPTLASLGFSTSFKPDVFSTKFHYPFIALDTAAGGPNAQVSGVLANKGQAEFAALEINLVSLLNLAVPSPPLSAKLKLDAGFGGGELSAAALSAKLRPALNLTQREIIQPLEHKLAIDFDFGQQYSVRVLSAEDAPLTSYQMVQNTADLVVNGNPFGGLLKGQKLEFESALGGDALLTLTPLFKANPTLTTEFGLSMGLSLPVELLPAKAKLKLFGLEADKSFRLAKFDNPLAEVEVNPKFSTTFALGGFKVIRGGSLVLSTSAYEWTGTSGTAEMFLAGNYTTGGQPANDYPTGQNVVIPSGHHVNVSSTGANSNGKVGTLTVAGNSSVVINPNENTSNVELTLEGNLKLDSQAQLLIKNNGTLYMTHVTAADIDAGGGSVQLDGGSATLRTARNLNLLTGTIAGSGHVNVGSDLTGGGQSGLLARGGTLEVSAERIGGTGESRLRLMADGNATLLLKASSLESVRAAKGEGKIVLDRDMSLANLVIDAGGKLETANNRQIMLHDGTLINHGMFTATAGTKFRTQMSQLTLEGTGSLELKSASLSGPTDLALTNFKLVNDAGHTIRLTGSGTAAINAEDRETWLAVENLGTIEAKMDAGGNAMINARSGAESFVNQGDLRGVGTVPLTLAEGSFRNDWLFDAGQKTADTTLSGKIVMLADASLENLSREESKYTLTGGMYRTNTTESTIALNLAGAVPAPTDFVNRADILLHGSGDNLASNLTINGTSLAQMNSFENTQDQGGLAVGVGGTFITPHLINRGAMMLLGGAAAETELGNVSNEETGTILAVSTADQSQARVRLRGENGTATNRGILGVAKSDVGTIKLTLTGDVAETNTFRNEGIVQVRGEGSELVFAGLSVDHAAMNGGDASFKGGTWIADNAQLALQLAAPNVLDADVSFIGDNSHIKFNGTEFESTIHRIGAAGKLRLDSRNLQFANLLNNQGEVYLNNNAVLNVPAGIVNNGVIVGGGLVNQLAGVDTPTPPDADVGIDAPVTNNNTIIATNGQLTFKKHVTNVGTIVARGPDLENQIHGGGIGLDGVHISGPIINGQIVAAGNIQIDQFAALWGWGRVSSASLVNQGTIMANDFNSGAKGPLPADRRDLTIDVNPGVLNRGEMVATAGRTLNLVSPGSVLDNTGTPADPVTNTAAVPGYLRVQYVKTFSGTPQKPLNGHLVIDDTTVLGGVLEVRGNRFDDGDHLLPIDEWASVEGIHSTLNGVIIDVDQGLVRCRNGAFFTIIPAVGTEAEIWGSQILAENGGAITLTSANNSLQKYTLFGTDVIARGIGQGGNTSRIVLDNVDLEAGKFATEQGGKIIMQRNVRMTNVSSEAALTVAQTLELHKIFFGMNGTIAVEADGALKLDGSAPIAAGNPSGADLIGGVIQIKPNARMEVQGSSRILGAQLSNEGLIALGQDQNLTIVTSPASAQSSELFENSGEIRIKETTLRIQNALIDMQTTNGFRYERGLLKQTGGEIVLETGGVLEANVALERGALKGIGTVAGQVAAKAGALEPGLSIGALTIEDSLIFDDAHVTLTYEFDTRSMLGDLLNVGGNLDINALPTLNLRDLATEPGLLELGTKFTLISYNGTWNGGTFKDLENFTRFRLNGNQFVIRYNDTTAGSVNGGAHARAVTLTVVPEPANLLLLTIAAAVVSTFLRRGKVPRGATVV